MLQARTLQLEVDRLQAALARSQAEAAADFRELKAAKVMPCMHANGLLALKQTCSTCAVVHCC